MPARRLGLVVNPIAGMGGAVGLKGSDGPLAARARELHAQPLAATRAGTALAALGSLDVEVLTGGGELGADVVAAAGRQPRVVYVAKSPATTARDTRATALALRDAGVDLLVFAGGDGTARDLLAAVGTGLPVLGIPAGVKMHSGVFAATPRTAGEIARHYLSGAMGEAQLHEVEIVDREERNGETPLAPVLYGSLRSPRLPRLVPQAKGSPAADNDENVNAAIAQTAHRLRDDALTLVGPGTTMRRLKTELGAAGSLLGVALFRGGACLNPDASEHEILQQLDAATAARVVVSVVGGQGFLFGRGNQQLSARVLRKVGLENLIVIASAAKLVALPAGALLVDTGDDALDAQLCGYRSVIVGPGRSMIVAVKDAASLSGLLS